MITQAEIDGLLKEGYTEEQISKAIYAEENDKFNKDVEVVNSYDDSNQYTPSSFNSKNDDNLVKWQIELNDILERAEHVLRGDIPAIERGKTIWKKNPRPQDNTLNEYGVQEVMKILLLYVNRNTILSYYEDEEIRYKVLDFGKRLNNLIFMKYQEFGMDSENKRKNYEMIVGELIDIVHSAYNRARNGGERRSLREMINLTQSQQLNPMVNGMGQEPPKKSIFNPARYLSGRWID